MSTPSPVPSTLDELRAGVQARYGATAAKVAAGAGAASCCTPAPDASTGCCGSSGETWDPITADLYDAGETAGLPAEAILASLGCGNPTALAELKEGETVLDLGSGGGIDVLLSARRVGPTGKAYGLDMTDEMLALAQGNTAKAGATNVEFLALLRDAGFEDPSIEPTRVYSREDAEALLAGTGLDASLAADVDGRIMSAFVRARKPGATLRPAIPADVPQSVAVAPAWRSRGLGRQLVTRVIAEAEARGIDGVYLLTTTAEHWFPSFGFTAITRDVVPDDVRATGEFREACPASAIVMARALARPERG